MYLIHNPRAVITFYYINSSIYIAVFCLIRFCSSRQILCLIQLDKLSTQQSLVQRGNQNMLAGMKCTVQYLELQCTKLDFIFWEIRSH